MEWKTAWMFMYGTNDNRKIGCRYGAVSNQDCLKQKEEEVDCDNCPRNQKIGVGDMVLIKSIGLKGRVYILEGYPARKAWIEVYPGAQGGYLYITMVDPYDYNDTSLLTLNVYDITDLEKIEDESI